MFLLKKVSHLGIALGLAYGFLFVMVEVLAVPQDLKKVEVTLVNHEPLTTHTAYRLGDHQNATSLDE